MKSAEKRLKRACLEFFGETSKAEKELKGAEEKLYQLLERRAQLGTEIVQTDKDVEDFEKEELKK